MALKVKTYNNVQANVTFSKASSRVEINPTAGEAATENIALTLGKISKWYEALVPTGGSSGKILAWNTAGTAKWSDPLHPTITKSADTTSTASPAHGGTFTTVDTVTRDTYGHVTKINTKTVTLPNDTLMTQTNTTDSADYRVLLSGNANDTTETTTGRKSTNLKFNPSSGGLYSFGFLWTDITGSTLDINTLTLSNGTLHSRRFIEKTDGGAANITNIPVTGHPFLLEVDLIRWGSTTDYITRQRFTNAANGTYSYVRYCTNGTWGSWTTRKYTDTDTKVTSSANHYTPATASGQDKTASASGATDAWSIDVVKGVTLNTDGKGHVTGISVTSGKIPDNPNTDRYVNTASFADDSTNTTASPVKMTLTRAGSDTATVTANIPKVSSSSAGVAPKGAAVSTQSQSTKFLREDGSWAAPSYTSIPSGNVTGTGLTADKVILGNGNSTIKTSGKGITDNSSATAVTSTDTNLITARTLYYAGYLPLSGGTMTGNITFTPVTSTSYPASSNQLYWSGSTDWAKIYYRVDASDAGKLVFDIGDDTNTRIAFAYNGTAKSYIDTDGNFSGNAANVTGTVAIANGGTGATTRLNALKNLTNENVGSSANYFLTITSSWGKGGYTSVADAKTVLGLKSAAYTESSAYLSSTTKYAGSSSVGGAATSANKLNTNAGSTNRPVYFSGGVPVQCDTPASGSWFKGVPFIGGTDGVMEIGKYIDFHNTNGSTADYDYRMEITTATMTLHATGSSNTLTIKSPGNAQLSFQTTSSGKAYTAPGITCYPLTDTGITSLFNFGGNLVIGGGESAKTLYDNNYDTIKTVENEDLYLCADHDIHIVTGCQTYADKSTIEIDALGKVYLPSTGGIIVKQRSDSNYVSATAWWKGGTAPESGEYAPQIGQHNTGGDSSYPGSICILPYKTTTSPWGGQVGLFIQKNHVYIDGVELSKSTHTHSYLPTAGGTMEGNISFKSISGDTYPIASNKIIWNGGTDGIDIYYNLRANDAGELIMNMRDDTNVRISFAHNGTVKSYIDTNGNFSGNAANVTGTVAIANGGTGATTRLNALKALTNEPVGTSATYFLTITDSWNKGGYSSVANVKTVLGLGSAAYTESSAYLASTTKYAGSSSAGGAATKVATEVGNTAGARPVFYAYLDDNTRVVYNTNFTYNPSGNVLTATKFVGALDGTANQAIKLRSSAARTDSTVDTADTTPYQKYWVKIASCYTTRNYTDLESLWAVNDVYGNRQGILKVRARVEGTAGKFGVTRIIRWLVADNSIDVNRFAIVCYNNRKPDGTEASGTATVELWWKSTGQYASFSFVLLDETRRTGKEPNDWVLYDTSTYGQAALPTTGNITYSVAATILNSTAQTYNIAKNPSTATTYAISFGGAGESGVEAPTNGTFTTGVKDHYINDGLGYRTREGVANGTEGLSALVLGNSLASSVANNKTGYVRQYSTNKYYTDLKPNTLTASRTILLPDASGTIAVFPAARTSGQVVVTDGTAGAVKSSGYTIATSVPSGAKFTDEKVTQTAVGSTYTNYRPIVISGANSATEGFSPSTTTDGTFITSSLYCQPSTGMLHANIFKAGKASTTDGEIKFYRSGSGNSGETTLKAKAQSTSGTYLLPACGNGSYTLSIGMTQVGGVGNSLVISNVSGIPTGTLSFKIIFKSDAGLPIYSMVEIPNIGDGVDCGGLIQVGDYTDGQQGSLRIVMKSVIIRVTAGSTTGTKTFTATVSPTQKISGSSVSEFTRNVIMWKIYACC